MTITRYDGVAILPKRCDKCNRLFWLEPYNIFHKLVGIEEYPLKQIECKDCIGKIHNILDLPSVNPQEPKTGHWERISNDITLIQHDTAYYKCSECGEKVIGKHNHCQFCGAKMVEPQESEEDV